jgi:hypothetical protein
MAKVFTILATLAMIFSISAQDDDEGMDPLSNINAAIRKKEFSLAESICVSELQKHPSDKGIQLLYSHALILHSKFRMADSVLRKVEESDTGEAGVDWFRGLSAERQLQDSLAAQCFQTYLRKTKNALNVNVSAWLHIGSAYRRMMHGNGITLEQFEEMLKNYKLYVEANPTDPYKAMLQDFMEEVKTRKPSVGARLVWDEKE